MIIEQLFKKLQSNFSKDSSENARQTQEFEREAQQSFGRTQQVLQQLSDEIDALEARVYDLENP